MSGDFVAREVNWGLGNREEQKVFFFSFFGFGAEDGFVGMAKSFPAVMHAQQQKKGAGFTG